MESYRLLVLDLDGTVRQSKSGKFISGPDDVELIPGVAQKLLEKKKEGYLIYGWTNQGGVAHGFKQWTIPFAENNTMNALLGEEAGEQLFEDIVVALMDPKGKGRFGKKTFLRKPSTGGFAVIEHLAMENSIIPDWESSMFVGDRPEDKESAELAGIEFAWAKDFFGF